MSHSDGCEPPTDQFIGATGLTATWEKSCNTVNTSQGIAALWWLLLPITCIYSCGTAVAAPSRMQNRTARRRKLQSRSICHHFESLGGKMQDHLFSIPLSLPFSLLIEADLYHARRSLDSCHHNRLHPPLIIQARWQQSGSWAAHYEMTLVFLCQQGHSAAETVTPQSE